MDLGAPASYLTLRAGCRVISSDGEQLGRVEHVLADPEIDIFDGIVIDRSRLPGGHRFVDAGQIDEIYEGGVLLGLDAEAARRLPTPAANPASMSADPAEPGEGELERKLRRAWEMISGKG